MIRAVNNMGTVCQDRIHITIAVLRRGTEVAFIVGANRAQALPAVLRMYQDRVIFSGVEVEHRLQHLVLYFDKTQSLIYSFFRLTGHNCHCITHKTDSLVQDQAVIRAWLRVGLARHGKTLLGTVLIRQDRLNPLYL